MPRKDQAVLKGCLIGIQIGPSISRMYLNIVFVKILNIFITANYQSLTIDLLYERMLASVLIIFIFVDIFKVVSDRELQYFQSKTILMAFLGKFKNKNQTEQPPPGVNLDNSSFAYEANQGSYQPQSIPEPIIQTKGQVPPSRQKGRPGGGWEDDSEDETPKVVQQFQQQTVTQPTPQTSSLIDSKPVIEAPKKVYEQIQLSRLQSFTPYQILSPAEIDAGNYEYEQNIVNEAIKLGGMRLKQSDLVLKDFGIAAENLQEQIIGSMLLNQLHGEDNWKVQARIVYAVEHLVSQIAKYKKYFEANINVLQIQTAQSQLAQLLQQVRSDIQGKGGKQQQEASFDFVEPPKPPQKQEQSPQPQQISNILEIDTPPVQPPKKNAFDLFNKQKPVEAQQQRNPIESLLDGSPQVGSVDLLSTTPEQQTKKPNSFGFIKKTAEPVVVVEEPKKPNSFGFIKKPQTVQSPTETNLLSQSPPVQQTPAQQPISQPQQFAPQPQPGAQLPFYQQPPPYQSAPYPGTPYQSPPYPYPPPQQYPGYPPPQYPPTNYPYPPYQQPQFQQYQYPGNYPPYYPPYAQQGTNQTPPMTPPLNAVGAPINRLEDVQLKTEQKSSKDESAFDFIKI